MRPVRAELPHVNGQRDCVASQCLFPFHIEPEEGPGVQQEPSDNSKLRIAVGTAFVGIKRKRSHLYYFIVPPPKTGEGPERSRRDLET